MQWEGMIFECIVVCNRMFQYWESASALGFGSPIWVFGKLAIRVFGKLEGRFKMGESSQGRSVVDVC